MEEFIGFRPNGLGYLPYDDNVICIGKIVRHGCVDNISELYNIYFEENLTFPLKRRYSKEEVASILPVEKDISLNYLILTRGWFYIPTLGLVIVRKRYFDQRIKPDKTFYNCKTKEKFRIIKDVEKLIFKEDD